MVSDFLSAVKIERWGLVGYPQALERQRRLHALRVAGRIPDTLVLVDHPPTVSLGRNAPLDDLLEDPARLSGRGVTVTRSDRGGRATYHGPGQVVLYAIVDTSVRGWGARRWVATLEGVLVSVLAHFGVQGQTLCGSPGVWTQGGKIASIGLRIARGVSYHGVAINVRLDPTSFDCIVTCGRPDERVSSLAIELGRPIETHEVAEYTAHTLRERLGATEQPCHQDDEIPSA